MRADEHIDVELCEVDEKDGAVPTQQEDEDVGTSMLPSSAPASSTRYIVFGVVTALAVMVFMASTRRAAKPLTAQPAVDTTVKIDLIDAVTRIDRNGTWGCEPSEPGFNRIGAATGIGAMCQHKCPALAEAPPLVGCTDCPGRYVLRGSSLLQPNANAIQKLPGSGVPMLVHHTWPGMSVKFPFAEWMASWYRCMPQWQHVLWTDDDIRELFERRRPSFMPFFDSFPYGVERADSIRYLALGEFGGLYVDMDYECVRDMDGADALGDPHYSAFASEGPSPTDGKLQNTLMAGQAGHPLWSGTLDRIERHCGGLAHLELLSRVLAVTVGWCAPANFFRYYFGGRDAIMSTTGPGMVSGAYYELSEAERATVRPLPVDLFNGQDRGPPTLAGSKTHCAPRAIHHNAHTWNSKFIRSRIPMQMIIGSEIFLLTLLAAHVAAAALRRASPEIATNLATSWRGAPGWARALALLAIWLVCFIGHWVASDIV